MIACWPPWYCTGNGSCPATPLTVLESSPDLSSFTQLLTTFGALSLFYTPLLPSLQLWCCEGVSLTNINGYLIFILLSPKHPLQTGLSGAVDNPTTFVTVFAPTNAAIAAAGIDPRDAMTTSAILENHILLGSRLLSSISSPVIQETQSGTFHSP